MNLKDYPHRRLNPLTGETVLVSPHRTKRPWQGKVESVPNVAMPQHDPNCYLCPGNSRAEGQKNPAYDGTFVFTNDFSALLSDVPSESLNVDDLLVAENESGTCRVVCFSPRHDQTLAKMQVEQILRVVQTWTEEYRDLGSREDIGYVQIFENRGEIMGCSNPHPHGQIWANRTVPDLPHRETQKQQEWLTKKGSCLLCDYVKLELASRERVVCENEGFVVLVPFWATWPFETIVLPKTHRGSLLDFSEKQKLQLAEILSRITRRYDQLFQVSFPYSMGLHQSPTDGELHQEWHFHMHFLPPLLRSATVKKFMVGYELLAQAQRDITPEAGAERLRACSEEVLS